MTDAPPPNPRAFAQATGFVFQIVGMILLCGGCCFGPVVGWFQGEQPAAPADVAAWIRNSPTHQLLVAACIIANGVAGLALAVFGMGLQQERKSSGTGALIAACVLSAVYVGCAVVAIVTGMSLPRIAVHVLLAGGTVVLVLMASAARHTMQVHPPPPDEPVTEAFLRQFDRKHGYEDDDSRD